MEMELTQCKIDIMSLNSQLLDAIQQKLGLSQELEAWQVCWCLEIAARAAGLRRSTKMLKEVS